MLVLAMAKRITIKDIARELEVHHSSVSRVLRNDPMVKEETRRA
jgi:DNA-binding LacI/PurR family transcriptional regulator